MNTLRQFSLIALAGIVCLLRASSAAAPSVIPDEQDRLVLETLLLHLLADPKNWLAEVPAQGATIVLHARTPTGTGFLQPAQMHSEIGDHRLPGDAESDLRRRNSKPDVKPDTNEAVAASFTDLKFPPSILVADLTDIRQRRLSWDAFEEAHPKARGWVEAYLPGYSQDGSLAVVRAGVGPSSHGAMVTALLEKRGDKWIVIWQKIAHFL